MVNYWIERWEIVFVRFWYEVGSILVKVQSKMNLIPFFGPWQYASDFLAPCYALSCNKMSYKDPI